VPFAAIGFGRLRSGLREGLFLLQLVSILQQVEDVSSKNLCPVYVFFKEFLCYLNPGFVSGFYFPYDSLDHLQSRVSVVWHQYDWDIQIVCAWKYLHAGIEVSR